MEIQKEKHINAQRDSDKIGLYLIDMGDPPKKSPLHEYHEKSNANFVSFGGWVWVDEYANNMVGEYIELNNGVVICDIHGVTFGIIRGSNVVEKLQPLLTNKAVVNKPFNTISYTGFLSPEGALFDDGMIYRNSNEEIFITLNEGFNSFVANISDEIKRGLEFIDLTSKYVKLQVQGPKAEDAVVSLLGIPPLKLFRYTVISDVIIAKSGYTLPGGYEIFVPIEKGGEYWTKFLDAGILPYGIKAMEVSRVESAKLRSGYDFFPHFHLPSELGFIGEEAETSLIKGEINTVYFISEAVPADEHQRPEIGSLVRTKEGQICGVLTSAVYSPLYHRYLGFCHLLKEFPYEEESFFVHNLKIDILHWKNARKTLSLISNSPLYLGSTRKAA
jgi:glycine cleavage system aminomethyltransferase T